MVSGGRFKNSGIGFGSAPRVYSAGDYAEICRWYVGHNETPPLEEWLPRYGRIVPEVAAGFLYRSDSKIGFLDCFVGNPEAPGIAVKKGIEAILKALADDAKREGMTLVYGNTKYASIAEIAKKLGGIADTGRYFAIAKVL